LRHRIAAQKADLLSGCGENLPPKDSTSLISVAKGLPRAQRSCLFGGYLQHDRTNQQSLIDVYVGIDAGAALFLRD
jgi:hypothetical protein